jgi:hypothetical protein
MQVLMQYSLFGKQVEMATDSDLLNEMNAVNRIFHFRTKTPNIMQRLPANEFTNSLYSDYGKIIKMNEQMVIGV